MDSVQEASSSSMKNVPPEQTAVKFNDESVLETFKIFVSAAAHLRY